MNIKETDNFIIFENVKLEELDFFHLLPYKFWFLKGVVRDGLFQVSFNATTLDIKKDDVKEEMHSDDITEMDFTLFFLKNKDAAIKNLLGILDDFKAITDELQQQCDDEVLKSKAQDLLKMVNR